MRTEVIAIQEVESMRKLDELVRRNMNIDFPEKAVEDVKEMSQEDKLFLNKVDGSAEKKDGHFHIKLPFRDDNIEMPDNEKYALQRLQGLKKRFEKNPHFHTDYNNFMENVIRKGYAEKVPEREKTGPEGKTWFIPHHGIYHPKKPNKIRVVFDCAAKYQGVSLNDVLLQGPNLTNNLIGTLLRFRQEPVAVMGDVESMYYQVKVYDEDKDFQRFYWWTDGDYSRDPEIYRMKVHMFGTVSSSSCASYALQKTAEENKDSYPPEITDVIRKNFYVDDCLASSESVDAASHMIREVTDLCDQGGFHIAKWVSNSRQVMETIPQEDRAKDLKNLNLELDDLPNERALGVYWLTETDELGFKITEKTHPCTKRGILSVTSSVYDPLGFAAPAVLPAKQLLQALCQENLSWDDPISDRLQRKWEQWLCDLPKLENMKIERCYKPENFGTVISCQLHLFSDASDAGYGIVAYIRLVNEKNKVRCCFVMAKSRVAPLTKVSVLHMELTAATVAARMSKMITRELQYNISETVFWTDSMSVIGYIRNQTARFHTFVANRIATIREASSPEQWRFVNSKLNPADLASRGANMDKFLGDTNWIKGPKYLWEPENMWPRENIQTMIPECDPEIKKPTTNCAIQTEPRNSMDKLLNSLSDWNKLRRRVAYFVIVKKYLKNKVSVRNGEIDENINLKVTRDILDEAEDAVIQYVQEQSFGKELAYLKQAGKNPDDKKAFPRGSSLYRLDPILVKGTIRVGGRLDRSQLPYGARHPAIIPKHSPVTKLVLEHVHRSVGHFGKNSMLASLRQKYWIPGAGAIIKGIVSKCVSCRKYRSDTNVQKMADLPLDRVTPGEPPFTRVGVNYFGPFYVKRGRANVKRYGVIFTCLACRAVHIELAHSLDTDSCINAIRRFVARRGPVKVMRSDNGTNLVGAERVLREEISKWNRSKIHQTLLQDNIDWEFNPPYASHHGGVWERIIRSIRKILFSLMEHQVNRLDDECLQTFFCEAESILNGRPITKNSEHPSDLAALTPNHLLLLSKREVFPPGLFYKEDNVLRTRWRQVQYLADQFWQRWVREYLPLLQQRQKWCKTQKKMKTGDVVLVMDSAPRHAWSLGRVINVKRDQKGLVRIVEVKTQTGTFLRPISKLCSLLEADEL